VNPHPTCSSSRGPKARWLTWNICGHRGLWIYIHRGDKSGTSVAGICGGYQMLGRKLLDPLKVESSTVSTEGLGLLESTATFEPKKTTKQIRALSLDHEDEVVGYEIHMGQTRCGEGTKPRFRIISEGGMAANPFDGAVSADGSVWGTYLHGVFDAPGFRRRILNDLRMRRNWSPLPPNSNSYPGKAWDSLATLIREHISLAVLDQILDGSCLQRSFGKISSDALFLPDSPTAILHRGLTPTDEAP